MKLVRTLTALLAIITITGTAAACGGDDDKEPTLLRDCLAAGHTLEYCTGNA